MKPLKSNLLLIGLLMALSLSCKPKEPAPWYEGTFTLLGMDLKFEISTDMVKVNGSEYGKPAASSSSLAVWNKNRTSALTLSQEGMQIIYVDVDKAIFKGTLTRVNK